VDARIKSGHDGDSTGIFPANPCETEKKAPPGFPGGAFRI
jgi:hypothetical protein